MVLSVCLALVLAGLGQGPIPASSRQLLLVTTPSWDATSGVLRPYERTRGGQWTSAGDDIPVVVGRQGLGWGRGLHAGPLPKGPVKAEGDGRAPAGVFRLSAAFGYGASAETGLPYVPASGLQCVDDRTSASYNLVRAPGAQPDWSSHETLRRRDGLYRIGAIVAHNGPGVDASLLPPEAALSTAEPVAGAGSCIFLHVWRGPGTTTAGCTALADPALSRLLSWLQADEDPVLVQLPSAVRHAVQDAWGLPD